MKQFGERLRFVRRQAKMTQDRLALKLGVSRDSISRWESGKDVPSARGVVQISETLQVRVAYLVGIAKRPQVPQAERDMMSLFRRLSPSGQRSLVELVKDSLRVEQVTARKSS